MNKMTLANLIYQQTLDLISALEACLAPPSIVKNRIRERLGLLTYRTAKIPPEELKPYIEAYWSLAYRFVCEEQNILKSLISDLLSEGKPSYERANEVLGYLKEQIGLLELTAAIMDFDLSK